MKFSFGNGEDKGMDCDINSSDGVVTAVCKRTKKQKDGSVITDGQEVNMQADVANDCKISYSGHMSLMDNDGFKAFDPVAKRLENGCRRISKRGLVQKPVQK